MAAILRPVALVAGWICMLSMAGFASILGLPTRHWALWPIAILLLPVALACVAVGMLAYPVNALASYHLWFREGTYASVGAAGLEVRRTGQVARAIQWASLTEVRHFFEPPVTRYEIVLASGEALQVDFLDGEDDFVEALRTHGVPYDDEVHDVRARGSARRRPTSGCS
jgi:hypothetical protein